MVRSASTPSPSPRRSARASRIFAARIFGAILFLFAAALSALRPSSSAAQQEREHVVRRGQSLGRIAQRYNVPVAELAAANQLRVSDALQPGTHLRIPRRGVYYVRAGQSLSRVAQRNGTTVAELCRVNRIRPDTQLQPGQGLVLPGNDALETRERAEDRWGRPRHPGVGSFLRLANHETLRIRLVESRSRRARRAALRRLKVFLADRQSGARHDMNPRLVELLAQISDHFGGRQIVVISGFREAGGRTRESSRHTEGRAIDFRIRGVDLRVLRDYVREFPRVGVGYYPNSRFVHLDVRDESAYWVDRSGRGQDADVVRPANERQFETPDEVAE